MIVLFLMGLVIGLVAGMIGIGGGLIAIPGMLYLYPMLPLGSVFTMGQVTGVSAVQTLAASSSASFVHFKSGNVQSRVVLTVGVFTMVGAYLGGIMSAQFDDYILKVIYAGLLSVVMVVFLRKKKKKDDEDVLDTSEIKHTLNWWLLIPLALLSGLMAGLMGIGGAVMIMPLLHAFFNLPLRQAIASTLVIVLMTSVFSVLGKAQQDIIPWTEALVMAAGSIAGAAFGGRISLHTPEKVLKFIFVSIVALTLIRVLSELAMTPAPTL